MTSLQSISLERVYGGTQIDLLNQCNRLSDDAAAQSHRADALATMPLLRRTLGYRIRGLA